MTNSDLLHLVHGLNILFSEIGGELHRRRILDSAEYHDLHSRLHAVWERTKEARDRERAGETLGERAFLTLGTASTPERRSVSD